jgi:hypothetical protein
MAYIEVPFTSGEKKLRPDGVVQVKRGSTLWTVLIEVKTGANELKAAQVESYLDVAREQGFNAVLTISNQLAGAPGEHPLTVDKRKLRKVSLHHLSWSQIRTEALVEQETRRSVTLTRRGSSPSSFATWSIPDRVRPNLRTWALPGWPSARPPGRVRSSPRIRAVSMSCAGMSS